MRLRAVSCILLVQALSPEPASAAGTATPRPGDQRGASSSAGLLGPDYVIETSFTFHAALLHWLDSLCGLRGRGFTAGKTVEAHRDEYRRTLGPPGAEDRRLLIAFAQARRAARAATDPQNPDAVTRAFFETESLTEALDRLGQSLDAALVARLADALDHFAIRYRRIWRDGAVARAFLARAAQNPGRGELASYLVRLCEFFGVSTASRPHPRLHVFPVVSGQGTHAQAIGHHLLLEVRASDDLLQQLTPIVHENAHLMIHRMAPPDAARLQATVRQAGPSAERAWSVLAEALPTALAQGEAGRRFDPRWTRNRPWYHTEDVDAYAKRLHPLVRKTLARGGRFDPAFLAEALAAYPGADATRRSP